MPRPYSVPVYKTAPVIRLLPPFIAGILLQWYLQIAIPVIIVSAVSFLTAYGLFGLLPLSLRFKLGSIRGLLLNAVLVSAGLLVIWNKDARHHQNWYGNYYKDSACIIATIAEPPEEKSKSYKAMVWVENIVAGDSAFNADGKLLLYFAKDSSMPQLQYGDRILVNKKLQAIKNSGNPGAFNYQQYAAFQQLYHNAFLKKDDWVLLPEKKINPFKKFLFTAREKILTILRDHLPERKDELGIAEALLIGYTNDLDKDLVQAYSNTGVVHIIAISGMHLGLIYVLLVWLFARIPGIKKIQWLQAFLILACLWLFSLLTGGAASVIRSAVMFTFITLGKTVFQKKSYIFSSLAASAFVMLCYNPYYLWDVGFQLSYLAVTGIVIFQRPVYNLLYIKNKWLDKIWQLAAVSLAAQILTFPVCIYYFHQFPNLFLITNIVAVPLSTIILFAEIALLALAWIPAAATYIGKITGWLLWLMNKFITWVNDFSFSVWDNIPATVLSTWLLYAVVIGITAWLLQKNKYWLQFSMLLLLGFTTVHAYSSWQVQNQQKLIVYNVPKQQAIDFVSGNKYVFLGDSVLLENGLLQNFHLKPGRIALQLNRHIDSMEGYTALRPFYLFGNKKVLVIDQPLVFDSQSQKPDADIVIISKNPRLYISQLVQAINCKQIIADASNSLWKIEKWKQDCDKLHLRFHSIPEEGAFVMDL